MSSSGNAMSGDMVVATDIPLGPPGSTRSSSPSSRMGNGGLQAHLIFPSESPHMQLA